MGQVWLQNFNSYISPIERLGTIFLLHAANVVGISQKQNTDLTDDSFCREKRKFRISVHTCFEEASAFSLAAGFLLLAVPFVVRRSEEVTPTLSK